MSPWFLSTYSFTENGAFNIDMCPIKMVMFHRHVTNDHIGSASQPWPVVSAHFGPFPGARPLWILESKDTFELRAFGGDLILVQKSIQFMGSVDDL